MRLTSTIFANGLVISGLFLLAACQNKTAADESVTNMVVDNTVGTASDAMTDVDATTGSAANMAADVGDAANTADTGDESGNGAAGAAGRHGRGPK
jgi:hypothetical protein